MPPTAAKSCLARGGGRGRSRTERLGSRRVDDEPRDEALGKLDGRRDEEVELHELDEPQLHDTNVMRADVHLRKTGHQLRLDVRQTFAAELRERAQ